MYHGNHEDNQMGRKRHSKAAILLLSLLLIAAIGVTGTMAILAVKTGQVKNTFTPAKITSEVTEEFNGSIKRNVNATNTGTADAYLRVKLVTYRVNDSGQRIGGTADIPSFTLGTNWVKYGEYYYYTLPVAPNEQPATDLIGDSGIELKAYTDADGGKQVIEVMAEAIQSGPATAAGEAWGVSISQNYVTKYQ